MASSDPAPRALCLANMSAIRLPEHVDEELATFDGVTDREKGVRGVNNCKTW